jgi:hypothetical protein
VPDAKTVWLYREQLTKAGALRRAFDRFDDLPAHRQIAALAQHGIDATVIEARRPRLNAEEKSIVRGGGTPPGWSKAHARQIDRDGLENQARPQADATAQRSAAPGHRDRHAGVWLQEPPRHRPSIMDGIALSA